MNKQKKKKGSRYQNNYLVKRAHFAKIKNHNYGCIQDQ